MGRYRTKTEILDAMKKNMVFNTLTPVDVGKLSYELVSKVKKYKKGQMISESGSCAGKLFLIVRGKAQVKYSKEQHNHIINVLEKGSVFGISCIFGGSGEGSPTDVRSLGDTITVEIEKKYLLELFDRYPSLLLSYLKFTEDRIYFLNKRAETLLMGDAESRILFFIENEAAKSGSDEIYINITKKQLADRLGISRASLYRVLGGLVEEGHILLEGKKIKILNKKEFDT